jgi:hypothetical protein
MVSERVLFFSAMYTTVFIKAFKKFGANVETQDESIIMVHLRYQIATMS